MLTVLTSCRAIRGNVWFPFKSMLELVALHFWYILQVAERYTFPARFNY